MKSLIPVLALACVATVAQAQTKMYKCTGEGRTVYQQTACASAAPASAAASAAAVTKAADTATPERAGRTRRGATGDSAASADMAGRLAGSRP